MSTSDLIRTLLVDDSPDVRALLRVAMHARGTFEVVGEADTGESATRLAAAQRPDVVVLDLGLPDLPARDLLSRMQRASPTSKIVIYSGAQIDRPWFEQRAAGFVIKDSDIDHLLDLLEQAGHGQAHDEASIELPDDVVAPAEARSVVRDLLHQWGYHELVDRATLVVSELVTNAVKHARSSCAVVVSRSEGGVRIEVKDGGGGMPDLQMPAPSAEGGRGLMIVSSLATAWGVQSDDKLKSVWVELSYPTTASTN